LPTLRSVIAMVAEASALFSVIASEAKQSHAR
jgi:hypothetical protein